MCWLEYTQHKARVETKGEGEHGPENVRSWRWYPLNQVYCTTGFPGPKPACVTQQIIVFSTRRPTPVWSRNRWWQKLQAPTIASQIPLYEHLKHIKNSLETHIAINVHTELAVPNGTSEYLPLLFKLMYNYQIMLTIHKKLTMANGKEEDTLKS